MIKINVSSLRIVYLLSHPLLNKLISFEFNPNELNDLVDQYISFLKLIAITLTEKPNLL